MTTHPTPEPARSEIRDRYRRVLAQADDRAEPLDGAGLNVVALLLAIACVLVLGAGWIWWS